MSPLTFQYRYLLPIVFSLKRKSYNFTITKFIHSDLHLEGCVPPITKSQTSDSQLEPQGQEKLDSELCKKKYFLNYIFKLIRCASTQAVKCNYQLHVIWDLLMTSELILTLHIWVQEIQLHPLILSPSFCSCLCQCQCGVPILIFTLYLRTSLTDTHSVNWIPALSLLLWPASGAWTDILCPQFTSSLLSLRFVFLKA